MHVSQPDRPSLIDDENFYEQQEFSKNLGELSKICLQILKRESQKLDELEQFKTNTNLLLQSFVSSLKVKQSPQTTRLNASEALEPYMQEMNTLFQSLSEVSGNLESLFSLHNKMRTITYAILGRQLLIQTVGEIVPPLYNFAKGVQDCQNQLKSITPHFEEVSARLNQIVKDKNFLMQVMISHPKGKSEEGAKTVIQTKVNELTFFINKPLPTFSELPEYIIPDEKDKEILTTDYENLRQNYRDFRSHIAQIWNRSFIDFQLLDDQLSITKMLDDIKIQLKAFSDEIETCLIFNGMPEKKNSLLIKMQNLILLFKARSRDGKNKLDGLIHFDENSLVEAETAFNDSLVNFNTQCSKEKDNVAKIWNETLLNFYFLKGRILITKSFKDLEERIHQFTHELSGLYQEIVSARKLVKGSKEPYCQNPLACNLNEYESSLNKHVEKFDKLLTNWLNIKINYELYKNETFNPLEEKEYIETETVKKDLLFESIKQKAAKEKETDKKCREGLEKLWIALHDMFYLTAFAIDWGTNGLSWYRTPKWLKWRNGFWTRSEYERLPLPNGSQLKKWYSQGGNKPLLTKKWKLLFPQVQG